MGVIFEIRGGAMAGKVIALKTGESLTVGRAGGQAQFLVAQDTSMSRVHFAVECTRQGSRVADRGSSNGTYLNGRKIQDAALLTTGDEIKAGQTVFAVRLISDEKLAAMGLPSPAEAPAEPRPEPAALPERPAERSSPLRQEPAPPQPAVPRDERDAELRGRVDSKSAGPSVPPPRRVEEPPQPPPRAADSREPVAPAPPVEEPPHFQSIPNPLLSVPEAPRVVERSAPEPRPKISQPPRQQPRPEPAVRGVERSGRARDGGFRVTGWSFPAAPAQWQVQEGFGLQQNSSADFPASVAVTEESLGGITLQQYVEAQIGTLRGYFRDARIEPTMPPEVGGAEECMAVDVRHATKDGKELVHRWIYARSGSSVGMLTVTAVAADLAAVLESLEPLLAGAAFQATVNA